jgi:hypothetical protein
VTYNADRRRNLSTDYVLRASILGAFVDCALPPPMFASIVREPAPLR